MPLKYQRDIEKLEFTIACPPAESQEIDSNITVFRYVYAPIEHPENFIPQALRRDKPLRLNSNDQEGTCSYMALSFFTDLARAMAFFKGFPQNTKNKLGYSHIAQGELIKGDGLMTPVKSNTHFDLHEFDNNQIPKKFKILNELI